MLFIITKYHNSSSDIILVTRFSAYMVRRRIREERKKSTQERIKSMKERQRKSESWKRRRSYMQPLCLGLAILVGSYMVYRFYLRY